MTHVDMLSDTTYREQAVRQLHQLLGNAGEFPVKSSQIYGLRQIARQQPDKVSKFAKHQGERAAKLGKQTEVDFWALVANLCSDSASGWSVPKQGHNYLPEELGDQYFLDIPGTTPQETQQNQGHNNKLKKIRQEWFRHWNNEHIPAFFERFCTHCLYCIGKAEMGQLRGEDTNETDQQTQQEQSENLGEEAMHAAFQQANLVE